MWRRSAGTMVLLATALICSRWRGIAATENLCYRINYNCDARGSDTDPLPNCANSLLVEPLDVIPAGHELLTSAQCGVTYTEGQPIVAGPWSTSGRTSSGGNCANKDAGGLFYAFRHPRHASSNTGFERDETAQFLFLIGHDDLNDLTNPKLYFLMGLDRPGNADGGELALKVTNLPSTDTKISLMDDGGDAAASGSRPWDYCWTRSGDCGTWDASNGRGSFSWKWWDCCTDGAVLGDLPTDQEYSFWVEMSEPHPVDRPTSSGGIDHFLFPSWNGNGWDETTVEWAQVANGIKVDVQNCNSYCSQYEECSRCASDDRCSWCNASAVGGTSSCLETSEMQNTDASDADTYCPSEDLELNGCDCDVCSVHDDCFACVNSEDQCVWKTYDPANPTADRCASAAADGFACDGVQEVSNVFDQCVCEPTEVENSDFSAFNSINFAYTPSETTTSVSCNSGFSTNVGEVFCDGVKFVRDSLSLSPAHDHSDTCS